MSGINYQELCEYLRSSQQISVSQVDVMRVERICIEKKLQPTERLVAYSTAAMIKFSIPVEQAIELAAQSLNLNLTTFIDSLAADSYRQLSPAVREAAASVRSRLMQDFNRELLNPTLSNDERSQLNSIPAELMDRYQAQRLKAQEPVRSQPSLGQALEQMQLMLGNEQKQLPGN